MLPCKSLTHQNRLGFTFPLFFCLFFHCNLHRRRLSTSSLKPSSFRPDKNMPFSRYTPRERAYSALGEEDDQLLEKTTPPTTRYSPKTTNKPRTGVLMKYLPFALFNITLGLATGYWLAALKSGSSSSSSNGIYTTTTTTTTNELGPEPSALQQIMRTRHDVPFSPNYDYMGPSAEAKANWVALTKSMSEIPLLPLLPLPPNRLAHQLIT